MAGLAEVNSILGHYCRDENMCYNISGKSVVVCLKR